MNRKALVGGLTFVVVGLVSAACAAPSDEGEESTDGALSVGECNPVADTARTKHISDCGTKFDVTKAQTEFNACAAAVRKPYDDETAACARATTSTVTVAKSLSSSSATPAQTRRKCWLNASVLPLKRRHLSTTAAMR